MEKEYNILEIDLNLDQINDWLEKLKELKKGNEHEHLKYNKGAVLVHNKF